MKSLKLILFFFILSNSNAQDLNQYEKEVFVFEKETLNYRILKPLNYNPNKQYPVHLFLHGAGERGNDNVSQLVHGGKLFLKKRIENNITHGSYFHKLLKTIGGDTRIPISLIIT